MCNKKMYVKTRTTLGINETSSVQKFAGDSNLETANGTIDNT